MNKRLWLTIEFALFVYLLNDSQRKQIGKIMRVWQFDYISPVIVVLG
jgi:hypothetical protein